MSSEELIAYTNELVKRAGIEDPDYPERFVKSLDEHPQIRDEYIHYLTHGSYSCAYSVEGYSIAENKNNPYRMTLLGFDTMMKLQDNPDAFISKMSSTTGTDYPGKY